MLIVGLAYIVFCWFFRLTGQSWAVRFMGLPQIQNGCHGIQSTPGSWWWFLGKWGHSSHTMLLLNSAMTIYLVQIQDVLCWTLRSDMGLCFWWSWASPILPPPSSFCPSPCFLPGLIPPPNASITLPPGTGSVVLLANVPYSTFCNNSYKYK